MVGPTRRMAASKASDEAIVAAIGRCETPSFEAEDEAVVYPFARQLVVGSCVDDATFASAIEGLGRQGVVELASLCGYYTLVSFTLNAFAVPLPTGVASAWPASADEAQIGPSEVGAVHSATTSRPARARPA